MANRGRPRMSEEEHLRGYRYSLCLDRDLKQYLADAAWISRTSITQYINDLIRSDMENHLRRMEERDAKIGRAVREALRRNEEEEK